jgi:hypothetical protein
MSGECIKRQTNLLDERGIVVATRLKLAIPARVVGHTFEKQWANNRNILSKRLQVSCPTSTLQLAEQRIAGTYSRHPCFRLFRARALVT